MPDLQTAALAGGSAVAGGGLALWWAKLLMQRMVKQYDEQHQKHDARIERLGERVADRLSRIEASQSAVQVRVVEIESMKRTIDEHSRELAVHDAEIKRVGKDLNEAHGKIRMLSRPRAT